MKKEAVTAGYYHSPWWDNDYPKIQILAIEELLNGARVDMPPQFGAFKQAPEAERHGGKQDELGLYAHDVAGGCDERLWRAVNEKR